MFGAYPFGVPYPGQAPNIDPNSLPEPSLPDLVTTEPAYFRRTLTIGAASIRRATTSGLASIRRTVTSTDGER